MTTQIKPIETRYNGRFFRSRLEARWAVFFDAIHQPWLYESEGFDLGEAGRYLPDFFLPKQKCWIEIKGTNPTRDEERKARALAIYADMPVYIFIGNVGHQVNEGYPPGNSNAGEGALIFGATEDMQYAWCVCPRCLRYGIAYFGRAERICGDCGLPEKTYTYDHPSLIRAFDVANSHRFQVSR